MSIINQFAAQGVENVQTSGQGSGLTENEVKGFANRGNLDTGLTSAIVSSMVSRPSKAIMPAKDAEVIVAATAEKAAIAPSNRFAEPSGPSL